MPLLKFIRAQDKCWQRVCCELSAGKKQSHWIWYVFPQIAGLGHSINAEHYAIESAKQAEDYYKNPKLRLRLKAATEKVLNHQDKSLHDIMGHPDDLKFISSMTLFYLVSQEDIFKQALDTFNHGEYCHETERFLA
ncbi:DUF1810 domain-containing protein [Thalassotalea sp. ND16A]|uniref:DUF1810 domain-containing protein n=1 Tax=Thalassotalea sp. ND16A TaxID=1535422 RepID=UPI00051A5C9D|nr:DUF1810 domain-containing protein [Thalassotalea sp. ND16A]KGJ99626.1 hypothetical protein ND16A_3726 [Thalassotalea sp. ND16A]